MTLDIDTPEKGFVESFNLYRKSKPSTTLIVRRNIYEPTLFRNTEDDRAETQQFGEDDYPHAQANGEKFTSREQLRGLDLLRRLDDETDETFVDDDYAYNEPKSLETTLNLSTATYGTVGTERGENFAIKSRVIEGYTYTTGMYNLTEKETRNAVYESGTMHSESTEHENGGDQSSALYSHVRVQPGDAMIHFVTLEAATPGMLLYVMHNLLNTGAYGARGTRTGRNVRNEILGIVLGNHDTSLSTGELLMEYHDADDEIEESIARYVEDVRRVDWDVYGELPGFDPYPEWFERYHAVAARQADDADDVLREEFRELTNTIRAALGYGDQGGDD